MKISILFLASIITAFAGCTQSISVKPDKHPSTRELSKYSQATFAAGYFWHEEAMFESIKGVKEAVSGYAGGTTSSPTYETIEDGNTGHAETVNVYYDSTQIDYPTLLKLYFAGQDPTQVNGQGPDRGTQYRSIVFYRNPAEKKQIDEYIRKIQPSFKEKIAAQVMPYSKFWKAEDYHQDFIEHNPNQGYVRAVSIPEIKELQKAYPQMIKPNYKY